MHNELETMQMGRATQTEISVFNVRMTTVV